MNELIVRNFDWDSIELLKTVKESICPTATDAEFAVFCAFGRSTGLNPLKREIWWIKSKSYTNKHGQRVEGKTQIMVGIQGYYSIANSHEQYDGAAPTEVIEENGKIVKAIAKVYRKDRKHPAVAEAYFDEYVQKQDNGRGLWDTKPRYMIAKVAESLAYRKAFPQELAGTYTPEEMPAEYGAGAIEVEFERVETPAPKPASPSQPVSEKKPKQKKEEKPKDEQAASSKRDIEIDPNVDYSVLGDYVIQTECSKQGQTVLQVLSDSEAWVQETLRDERKRKKLMANDLKALTVYGKYLGLDLEAK